MAKIRKRGALNLMLVEWVDSVQPEARWRYLNDLPKLKPIKCKSIGWLVRENMNAIMLAPNIGECGPTDKQACGIIRIPTKAILRATKILCP